MGKSEMQKQAPDLLMIHMLRIDRKGIRSSEHFHFTAISRQADEKSPWLQSRSTRDRPKESFDWKKCTGPLLPGKIPGIFIYLFIHFISLFAAIEIQRALWTRTRWPLGWGASRDLITLQLAHHALFWPLKTKKNNKFPWVNKDKLTSNTALFAFFLQIIQYIGSIVAGFSLLFLREARKWPKN